MSHDPLSFGLGEMPEERLRLVGDSGRPWLEQLPGVVAECVARWSLTLHAGFSDLSYNYAAPGVRADGSAIVLKVCYPDADFRNELAALQLFAGRGVVRLLEADASRGAMLLERLIPGVPLSAVGDAERQANIAASVMRKLWRPAPPGQILPSVATWIDHMADAAPKLLPGSAMPPALVERALALYSRLSATASEPVLLHGDLHQGNILSAQREAWLAIDPKGVTGPAIWETGPLLLNLLAQPADTAANRQRLDQFVARLAEELGFSEWEIRAWGVVRAVLASFWSLEDSGTAWHGAQTLADLLDRPGH